MKQALLAGWALVALAGYLVARPPSLFPPFPCGTTQLNFGVFAGNWGLRISALAIAFLWLAVLAGWGRRILHWVAGPSTRSPVPGPGMAPDSQSRRRSLGVAGPGLGFGVAGMAVLGTGLAGILYPAVLAVVLAIPLCIGREWRVVRVPRFRPGDGEWKWLAAAALPVLAALPLALTPEVSWDAMVYHLRFPSFHLLSHRWFVMADSPFAGYPDLMEMHYTLALCWGGLLGDQVAKFMHAACWLLAARAIFTAASPWGKTAAWGSVLVWLSAPLGMQLAGVSYVDHATAWMAALAAALALAAAPGRKEFFLAGLFAGLAFGTKYTGGLAALGVAVMAVSTGRGRLAITAAAGLVLAGFIWPARNWLLLGDPLYPFLAPVLGGVDSPAVRYWPSALAEHGTVWGILTGFWTKSVADDGGITAVLGPLWLVVMLPALLLAPPGPGWRFFLPVFLAWLALSLNIRFFLPFIPAGLMAAAPAWRERGVKTVLVAATLAFLPFFILDKTHVSVANYDALWTGSGFASTENYLRTGLSPAPEYWEGAQQLNRRSPSGARFLFFSGIKSYYIDRFCAVVHQHIDPTPVLRMAGEAPDAERMGIRMRQRGFSGLVFLARAVESPEGNDPLSLPDPVLKRYVEFLRKWTKFDFRAGEFLFYTIGRNRVPRKLGVVPVLEQAVLKVFTDKPAETSATVARLERLAPESSSVALARGVSLLVPERGKEAEAADFLARAARSLESSYVAWRAWAYALSLMQEYERAVECGQRAIELNPDDGEAHFNLALSLERLGMAGAALEELRAAVRVSPERGDFRAALERLATAPRF